MAGSVFTCHLSCHDEKARADHGSQSKHDLGRHPIRNERSAFETSIGRRLTTSNGPSNRLSFVDSEALAIMSSTEAQRKALSRKVAQKFEIIVSGCHGEDQIGDACGAVRTKSVKKSTFSEAISMRFLCLVYFVVRLGPFGINGSSYASTVFSSNIRDL